MKKIVWLMLLLPIFLSSLTLEESIDLALKNNKKLKIAREEINKYKNEYNNVKGMLLPQIKGTAGYKFSRTDLPESKIPENVSLVNIINQTGTYSLQDSIIASSIDGISSSIIPENPSSEHALSAGLSLQQVIFSGGKLIKGIRVAKKMKNMQEKQYIVDREDCIYSVKQKFYQTILAGKVYKINQEAFELAKKHEINVERMFNNGLVSEFDFLRAQIEVNKIKPRMLKAKNDFELIKQSFANDIGITASEVILETDFNFEKLPEKKLKFLQKEGIRKRIELDLASIGTEIRKTNVSIQKGNYLPTIGLSGSFNTFMQENEFEVGSDNFGSSYEIGIGFEIPIFTGFSNSAKYKKAKNEFNQSKISEINYRELIVLDIKNSYQEYSHALESLKAQEMNLKLAEKSLEIAEVRYKNKIGIQLEVFDAQIQKRETELSYINALYNAIITKEKLIMVTGNYSK